ncbi:MAG: hydantoinase B/oxoprolinase family protein, partial [Deltaproteobacteria bacterium]|nr:hydantoinase B/oxoprolinase family protein [Kofleriaceae bacterium]
ALGDRDATGAAAAFAEVASANMAEAVREVTIARGRDVRDFALVVFGGAGGMHACPVAEMLGVSRVIVPRFAGLLSAWGMGLAPLTWHAEVDGGRVVLDEAGLAGVRAKMDPIEWDGRFAMTGEAADGARVSVNRTLGLRYRGSDTALEVAEEGSVEEVQERFAAAHRVRFGYAREAEVEIAAGRVEVVVASAVPALPARAEGALTAPRRRQAMWSGGAMHEDVPVWGMEDVLAGAVVEGPALLLDAHASVVVDVGWRAVMEPSSVLRLEQSGSGTGTGTGTGTGIDAVSVAVHANLYMSIAGQMGTVLERTAVSTNIRERRDFSCALFDARGGLVANAPHIPVHLGAMGETIRSLLATVPAPPPGTVYATNHPAAGGSHLPDITVITPVHDDAGRLLYILANRGHHADVGGLTPGSMPPSSRTLADEGIALEHLPIVVAGHLRRDAILAAFTAGPHPARRPLDNLADLEAQIAANHAGARLVAAAMARTSPATFLDHMGHVQAQAAALVARAVETVVPRGARPAAAEAERRAR